MKALRSIGTNTQICAVIGSPISHSLSPAIHNAAYEALNLDFVYVACEVSDVKSAVAGLKALGNFRGFSVTIPHKLEVMRYVDEIDTVDRSIGAINTVICEQDKLIGMGTDGPGALKAMTDASVDFDGKNVLILGAGGAARSIAFPLACNTKISGLFLLDINTDFLQSLSNDLKASTQIPIESAKYSIESLTVAIEQADIIIHCTSLGMHPKTEASLIPKELFRPGQVVFDVVYTPLETKLLADAGSRGLKVISGVEMFINQAVLQFEKFTGCSAPVEVMRNVIMEHLRK
ncbi:MAG: shikimate dehydrogenase [Desulfobacteraceae bacterium]|jgi:shikimate dehydrogenase